MFYVVHVIDLDQLQYGIADYIGFVGYDMSDMSEISFPFPFSTSLQLPPVLLQTFNCEELKNKFPNKLEWFCFPSNQSRSFIMFRWDSPSSRDS